MDWNKILDEADGESLDFDPLPKGDYDVVITSASATTAQSGNKMLKVEMTVQDGPYAKRKLWTNIVFAESNPKAMVFTLRKLAALGVSKEWLGTENPSLDTIASRIEGVAVSAVVEQKPYQGEMRNEVKSFKRAGGPEAAAPAPAAAAAPATPTAENPPPPPV